MLVADSSPPSPPDPVLGGSGGVVALVVLSEVSDLETASMSASDNLLVSLGDRSTSACCLLPLMVSSSFSSWFMSGSRVVGLGLQGWDDTGVSKVWWDAGEDVGVRTSPSGKEVGDSGFGDLQLKGVNVVFLQLQSYNHPLVLPSLISP